MSEGKWYLAIAGKQEGPFTEADVLARIQSGGAGRDAHVFTEGMGGWEPIANHPTFSGAFASVPPPVSAAPPPPVGLGSAHEIEYQIFGEEMQYVEIILDPGEACVAEAGAFLYMDPGIEMETVFGDGSERAEQGGIMDKLVGAGKRLLTGESLFMTIFANSGTGKQKVAFASPYPGSIVPFELKDHGNRMLCQKDAFLCAARGVEVGIALQRKLGAGFFGGEGFILQKLEGDGLAFVHAGGAILKKELAAGETARVDTGCLVAFEQSVNYDIQFVGKVKTALFGGEGIFFASLTGPGQVWLQSLPFSRLASRVYAAAPQTGGRSKGEGSVLGGLGNLFEQ